MTAPSLFLIDTNLGLNPDVPPWNDFFPAHGISTRSTTDLVALDVSVDAHEPDIVFLPIADYLRLLARGDRSYRGLVALTSARTGSARLPSVLVVLKDDPAATIDDLRGATLGYINRSCSSSFFAPAIVLHRRGDDLASFFELHATGPWQAQIDAVITGQVRATMVVEDVWLATPANAEATKVIGRYDNATGAVVAVRDDLDCGTESAVRDALLSWQPGPAAIFGRFAPYRDDDIAAFRADVASLPPDL